MAAERLAQQVVLLGGEERRGRLLDQLLVAALQRAVPGGHDDHVAVGVGQALGLDVPRPVQVALHEALAAAERRHRLAHRRLELRRDLLLGPGHPQAAAAAAEGGLDRDGQAVLGREHLRLGRAGHRPVGARRQRRADRPGDVPRADLVAQRLDRRRRRPDPGQPGRDDLAGEVRVLGQEAVARVHRVRAGVGRRLEDLADVQVAVRGALAAQRVGLVGHRGVQRVQVRLAVDGDAGQPGVPAGPDDPDGDLAAVGDQYLAHGPWLLSLAEGAGQPGTGSLMTGRAGRCRAIG